MNGREALRPDYALYNRQVLANARVLASALDGHGIPVVTGGTDTPFVVADLHRLGLTGRDATLYLENCRIGANAVPVPGDLDFENAHGLRLGTSAITTRGLQADDCVEVAAIVAQGLRDAARGAWQESSLTQRVARLCARFPLYSDRQDPDYPQDPRRRS